MISLHGVRAYYTMQSSSSSSTSITSRSLLTQQQTRIMLIFVNLLRYQSGSTAAEVVVELSAKEIKAAEKLARKAELAAKKEARLEAKKATTAEGQKGETDNSESCVAEADDDAEA